MNVKRKYDVIVMGAGSTGSSITYYLAKKGLSNVLVLDASCVGCGQTSRSSAVIRLHYTNPVIREMAVYSWRFWRNFREATGCEYPVFTKTGVAFAGPEEYVDSMKNVVDSLKKLGADASLYDAEEFKQDVFRNVNTEDLSAVAWEPESGYGDPNTAVHCFLDYAAEAGVEVREHTPVRRLIRDGEEVTGVETDKEVIEGEYIVNALGVWANDILNSADIQLPLKYVREDVLYVKNPENNEAVPPGWGDLDLGFYSRPEGSSYTLIGALEPDYVEKYGNAGEYSSPSVDLIRERTDPFIKRFPDMLYASPYSGIYGFYDVTPDWQPIIGFDSRIKNLIHMVGLSGHGFKLAPAYGDAISDMVLHGESRRFNVKDFTLSRFERKESRHSAYKYGIIG